MTYVIKCPNVAFSPHFQDKPCCIMLYYYPLNIALEICVCFVALFGWFAPIFICENAPYAPLTNFTARIAFAFSGKGSVHHPWVNLFNLIPSLCLLETTLSGGQKDGPFPVPRLAQSFVTSVHFREGWGWSAIWVQMPSSSKPGPLHITWRIKTMLAVSHGSLNP